MKPDALRKDVAQIRFSAEIAWILIIFGSICLVLGVLLMTPISAHPKVEMGMWACGISICALVGGLLWLKFRTVQLRLTPDELQLRFGRPESILWVDIEHVDLRTLKIKTVIGLVCIKLTPERAATRKGLGATLQKMLARIGGDFDLLLDDRRYECPAAQLVPEFNRRISLAKARQRGHEIDDPASIAPEVEAEAVIEKPSDLLVLNELGRLRTTHSRRYLGEIRSFFFGTLIIGMACAVFFAPQIWPPRAGQEVNTFGPRAFGIAIVVFGSLFIVLPLLKDRPKIEVHEGGFVLHRRRLRRLCRWKDVVALRWILEEELTRKFLVYVIDLTGDKTIEVEPHAIDKFNRLVETINEGFTQVKGPQSIDKLEAGKTLPFESLVLTRDGIQAGQQFVPWQDIDEVASDPVTGCIGVRSRATWTDLGVNICDTTNFPVIVYVAQAFQDRPRLV